MAPLLHNFRVHMCTVHFDAQNHATTKSQSNGQPVKHALQHRTVTLCLLDEEAGLVIEVVAHRHVEPRVALPVLCVHVHVLLAHQPFRDGDVPVLRRDVERFIPVFLVLALEDAAANCV